MKYFSVFVGNYEKRINTQSPVFVSTFCLKLTDSVLLWKGNTHALKINSVLVKYLVNLVKFLHYNVRSI